MKGLIIICLMTVLMTVISIGCLNSSDKSTASKDVKTDLYSSKVTGLLSKQVDSASNGLLQFKNFQKQDEEYIKDGSKAYNYALSFIGSIVAKSDCYWNIPSDHLYNGEILQKIVLDVSKDENLTKSNSYLVRNGLGVPVKGIAYFRKQRNDLVIFDFTIKVDKSVISK